MEKKVSEPLSRTDMPKLIVFLFMTLTHVEFSDLCTRRKTCLDDVGRYVSDPAAGLSFACGFFNDVEHAGGVNGEEQCTPTSGLEGTKLALGLNKLSLHIIEHKISTGRNLCSLLQVFHHGVYAKGLRIVGDGRTTILGSLSIVSDLA